MELGRGREDIEKVDERGSERGRDEYEEGDEEKEQKGRKGIMRAGADDKPSTPPPVGTLPPQQVYQCEEAPPMGHRHSMRQQQ
jgi:hypothetical protein